jgi:hypothetical protein
MRNILSLIFVGLFAAGCVATNVVETGRFPTPDELKSQVQADGCLVAEGSKIASPVVAATAGPAGIAADALAGGVGTAVCDAPK